MTKCLYGTWIDKISFFVFVWRLAHLLKYCNQQQKNAVNMPRDITTLYNRKMEFFSN